MTLLYLFLFNLILGLEVIEDDSLLFESAEQVCNFFVIETNLKINCYSMQKEWPIRLQSVSLSKVSDKHVVTSPIY